MSRSNRREIAKDSLKLLEQGYYINNNGEQQPLRGLQEDCQQGTQLWTPEQLEELLNEQALKASFDTKFEVNDLTSLDALRQAAATTSQPIGLLNFASAKNPGGGFLGGSRAQEESIARASGLYSSLLKARAYYDFHRHQRTCLYSDHMIFSPKVPVFKLEDGSLMDEPVLTSIITSPAVNAGVVRRQEKSKKKLILPTMQTRIDKMLGLFAKEKQEVIILGAWGCGVFQNEPTDIAQLFSDALYGKYNGAFDKVIFAVYSKNPKFITPFQEMFV